MPEKMGIVVSLGSSADIILPDTTAPALISLRDLHQSRRSPPLGQKRLGQATRTTQAAGVGIVL